MPATPATSPRLTFDDASDTAPPSATASRPCDCIERVASSSSEPPALSVAPLSMRIEPLTPAVAPRSTWACAPADTRNSAPSPSALIEVAVLPEAVPAPDRTLPLRTSMLSFADSSNSGAASAPAALFATTICWAWVAMRTPSPSALRSPPSSRLPPSADKALPSSCKVPASKPTVPTLSTTAIFSALMSICAARPVNGAVALPPVPGWVRKSPARSSAVVLLITRCPASIGTRGAAARALRACAVK